ncbi:MAG: trigger factor [Chitinivibrionales bacterium]|nr:trigger factor [Chitinivibrionales bacterium]MBD3397269.1 trigger factor [Chitinivibrionales bacterium]
MKANVSEPTSWQRVLNIEIPEDELQALAEQKQQKYRKQIRIPGFRKGKVPVDVVKSRYGPAIRAEAVEDLIQKSYEQACKDNSIIPISEARISDLKADQTGPVTFTVETEVDPPVEIKGYHKLKARPNPRKIKPAEVDNALEELRNRLADVTDVDRPAKNGDLLTIEYVSVSIDGEPRSDFKNPQYPIELGAGKIKDFDKGFAGHTAGETVDIKVKFPKDYAEKSVAGKTGQFQIKINKVQEKILPEIDDAFLKKVGDFADEAALRQNIQADLERQEMERAKNEAYNKAIELLIKNNPFDVPQSRVEAYIDHMTEEAAKYRRDGQPAPGREAIAAQYREMAVKGIKRYRIIDFVARAESIKATQDEVDARIRQMAQMYNQDFDQLKTALRQNGTTNRIRADIREQKTLDFLVGELDPSAQ